MMRAIRTAKNNYESAVMAQKVLAPCGFSSLSGNGVMNYEFRGMSAGAKFECKGRILNTSYRYLVKQARFMYDPFSPEFDDPEEQSAAGVPFSANCLACKGDAIANLQEDLAAEQKARATYEKLIDLCRDNPDVVDPLRFLRERDVVHFQRFGEALRGVQDKLADKKFYMIIFAYIIGCDFFRKTGIML